MRRQLRERMNTYDVLLRGKVIDTVFYQQGTDPVEVKSDLIDDGYDPRIEVFLVEEKRNRKQEVTNMRRVRESGTIVEVEEDVRIPGTDVILEKGDRIEVFEAKHKKKEEEPEDDDQEYDDDDEVEEKKKKK